MPTTLQNVKALVEEGIVEETGEYESTGGRKAKALSICGDAGYAVGVDITNNHITMVIVNAKKEIMASERVRCVYENCTQYYDFLVRAVSDFIEKQGVELTKIAGIGFSLPGIVDKEQSLLLRSHTLKVQNVSFRSVGDALGYSFSIENDANSAAYAELGTTAVSGDAAEDEEMNAVYLSLSNTVGGSICFGGQLYPGDNFKSGEFGHMGLVMTDWQSVAAGQADAGEVLAAQNDLIMAGDKYQHEQLFRALKSGKVKRSALEACASRILALCRALAR